MPRDAVLVRRICLHVFRNGNDERHAGSGKALGGVLYD